MAEIKSTMDLVLERTRHLSMSEEEKKEKREEEAAGRIRGVLQKVQDKAIKVSEAEREIENIHRELGGNGIGTDELLKRELVDRLDFEQDNTVFLRLLETLCNVETASFHDLFAQYRRTTEAALRDRLTEMRIDLNSGNMISGSAVIPNSAADPEWRRVNSEIKTDFEHRLKQQIRNQCP